MLIFTETIINKKIIYQEMGEKSEEIIRQKNKQFYSERYSVNCELILKNDENEIQKAGRMLMQKNKSLLEDDNFIFTEKLCSSYREQRGHDEHEVSKEELDMPLAFSILTYHNTEQFERLLRVIYRPHNIYCIHVDSKSSKTFHDSIYSIVKCFDNVFIASELESIVYAGFSRLQADLNCMSDLLNSTYKLFDPTKRKVKWKYLFNLASTEFPLKTNYEIVEILKLYNGANDIEVIRKIINSRVLVKWVVKNNKLMKTNITKDHPPHNFILVKGLAYGIFSRDFVDYIINNQYAIDLRKYLEDTYSPDET